MVKSTVKDFARQALPPQIDESAIVHQTLKGRPGVMVDVGAHYGSSLAPFARSGWTVHAFEPDPENRLHLERGFAGAPGVHIVSKGVSDSPGELSLYTSSESTGISSLAPFTDSHQPTATVQVTTLANYVAEEGIEAIDFLKIDVEGFERNVLRGHDWSVKPQVVVLEFENSKTIPLGYSWTDLGDELVGHGYEVLVSEWDPIERYGVHHSWRRFQRYPTTLQHDDAWGNLIAARDVSAIERVARRTAVRYRTRRRVTDLARNWR